MVSAESPAGAHEALYRPDAALRLVQAQHGVEGLRAIAAFMRAMGADAYLSWDEYACPCDKMMQEAMSLGGEPMLHVIKDTSHV